MRPTSALLTLCIFSCSALFGAGAPQSLGHLRLGFEPNRGQGQAEANFFARGAGYTIALLPQGVSMNLGGPQGKAQTFGFRLEGAAAVSHPAAVEPLPGKVNYFFGSDPRRWRTALPTFAKVNYPQVYPGIDVSYYGLQNKLEFDFIVHAGADASRIRLKLAGASASVDANGDLVLGQWRQHKPVAYQLSSSGQRIPVDCAYELAGNVLTLQLGKYDHSTELVIDPVVSYATYLGGASNDAIAKLKVDSTGNVYVVGSTTSMNFPAPGGAQKGYAGSSSALLQAQFGDAFVAKLNPSGTALIYSSYIGGSGDDLATSVAVDGNGSAYVTGSTQSSNFPVSAGAFQPTYKGFTDDNGFYNPGDGFVTKLSAAGDQLIYSSYLGGKLNDMPASIALGPNGSVVVVGSTGSTDFPTTAGAYSPQFRGAANFGPSVAGDGFLTIVNSTGTALLYSTFIGGRSHDGATGVALDSQSNIYICGLTFSGDFPVSAGALQGVFKGLETNTDYNNAAGDAFVMKFSSQGALVYSTYLGGALRDAAAGIAVGADGSAYVTGITTSRNFPVSGNAAQKTYGGDRAYGTVGDSYYGDAFLANVNANGTALTYATYLGGKGDEAGMDVVVDASGNAYVAGFTTSNEFPVTSDALQKTNAGLGGQGFAPNSSQGFPQERVRNTGDAFLAKFSPDGSLAYSSFYGGAKDDGASAVAVDGSGNVYIAGSTLSSNLSSSGVTQSAFGGVGTQFPRGDGFIAKFSFGTVNGITSINTAWGGSDISQNTFIEIKGTNLVPANTPAGGVIWSNAPEFQSGQMPTKLGGVSVTVNGKPAFIYFFCSKATTPACATDQINVLTPLDSTVGPASVVVTSDSGVTAPFTVQMKAVVPTFLLFSPGGSIVATHADYSLLGAPTLFPGSSTPARVGETVVTYSVGYGLPTTALTNGSSTQTGSLQETPVCSINNVSATVFGALIAPGLYQLNITVPAGAKNGDNAIGCSYRGTSTPAGATIAVSVP